MFTIVGGIKRIRTKEEKRKKAFGLQTDIMAVELQNLWNTIFNEM
jgi:hypothetical protein